MSFLKGLFKQNGIKDVITLFHNPSSAASVRVHTLLKQASANAVATATEDQASDHPQQSKTERTEFELDMESVKAVVQISVSDKAADIQEAVPTGDQLRSILEYLGPNKAGTVIEDATSTGDAIKKFKDNGSSIQRPITVDWNQGRVVVGDNESEILKLIKALPKKD